MSIVIYFEIIKITSIILLFFNWEIVKGPINPDHKTKSNIFQANKKKCTITRVMGIEVTK